MTDKTYPVEKTDAEWKAQLTPDQYAVLRGHGTERPGSCALLNEKRVGTFSCAGCDQPLFMTGRKFESGTGWPSFFEPLEGSIETTDDTATAWCGPRCTAAVAAATSATCSRTVRRRPACATASTASP